MDNAQRLEESRSEHTPRASTPGRGIPTDWFLDPADPQSAERRADLEASTSLEDQATALLVAHEDGEGSSPADTDGDPTAEAEADADEATLGTVTALHPDAAPSRDGHQRGDGLRSEAPQRVWVGAPSLVEPQEVEGELTWQVDALCAQTDPEAFFPEKGGSTRDAKKVCAACSVRAECLEYALANDERFGIWGGLSERERRRLRKRPS